jgi:hypothetical protein
MHMRPNIQSWSAGRCGAGLVLAVLLMGAGRVAGGDVPAGFGWQNLEFTTYAPNSIRAITDIKVERVFLDHRKMGFFRVKLLPVLVVQGVRLEYADARPTNEWAEVFHADWLPDVKRSAVEWRDVVIGFQKQGAPRLHAGAAQLAAAGSPEICTFRDVTLEARGATRQLPRAELRNENGRARVVWKSDGGEQRLDLFSGEMINNPESNGAKK